MVEVGTVVEVEGVVAVEDECMVEVDVEEVKEVDSTGIVVNVVVTSVITWFFMPVECRWSPMKCC